MIIRILAIISFVFVFFVQMDVSHAEEIQIDIEGEVLNLTEEIGAGEMISVVLHISSLDSNRDTRHTYTDVDSRFRFNEVAYSSNNLYNFSC